MASSSFGSGLLFAMVVVTHVIEASTKLIMKSTSDQSSGSPNTLSSLSSEELGHGLQRRLGGYKEGLNAVQLSDRPCHVVIQTQYDRPELEGLSPVRVEMGPGDKRKRIMANSKSHQSGYREFEKHRTKALNGREPELAIKEQKVSVEQSLGKPTFSPMLTETSSGTSISSVSSGGGDVAKDVVSILGMTLSDRADYEAVKPAETQQPSKKKGRQYTKRSSSEKKTMTSKEAVSCDHHLDCVPGSCCNLRKHTCDPHNRGLNNKCYDDCMCEEGLRCFSKFHHHHQNVIRKKGRCVDPEYINTGHRAFTAV
ncbi:draxin-B [Colossoma macropomum]|uniref:draxin-B n=1 Tax=Colossoma macropomum TaxID=42526 RepID=UPI001864C8DB|nr:draxin-B [Colossoma macropomum]